jgi:multidrug efflux system membrane fusion protein
MSVAPTGPIPPEQPAPDNAARGRIRRLALGITFVLAIVIAWQVLTSFVAYTDDAYVTSNFVAVAPQVSGVVATLPAVNNRIVRKGDLLATLDRVPFQLAVDERRAALQQANAAADAERNDLDVIKSQLDETVARSTLDKAEQTLAAGEAAVARAKAALALAEWQLAQTEIRAPANGTINNLGVSVGDTATSGKPLIGIVDAAGWRIVANYKEDYIRNFKAGGAAWVWLDTHPWRFYRARIDGISRGISRDPNGGTILPYVTPTTDWIRLQRRFPVTISLVDPPADLTLYMGADARTWIFP